MNYRMKKIIYPLVSALFLFGCAESYDGELVFAEPHSDGKFEFPYFLFIPEDVPLNEKVYVVVEPNNSGFVDDDLQKHIEKAKRTAYNDYYLGSYVAQNIKSPLLVPVFPRRRSDWNIYTHALDRDVMLQKNNSLERIDRQLLDMFEDARLRLESKNILTRDEFLLTGFSASASFANRFALLHPGKVFAVAAGGLNGLLMLPRDSLNNELLKYPVGTSDMKDISGKAFRKEMFRNTPQFYFMGQLDENDAIPYDDAFGQSEREQIFRLLGKQMQPERWKNCIQIYDDLNVNAIFKTYKDMGHEHPEEIKEEVLEFFKTRIEGM